MRGKKGNYGRPLLLLALFLGLSFGIFFSAISSANATPEMSPDGKTCTPCHTDGRTGTGAAGGGQEQKPAGEAQKPADQAPATQTQPAEQTPAAPAPAAKEPASPVLVIGLVAVVLGVIYVVAIRKKH